MRRCYKPRVRINRRFAADADGFASIMKSTERGRISEARKTRVNTRPMQRGSMRVTEKREGRRVRGERAAKARQ